MKWRALPIIHAPRRVYTCKTVVYPQIARLVRRQAQDNKIRGGNVLLIAKLQTYEKARKIYNYNYYIL